MNRYLTSFLTVCASFACCSVPSFAVDIELIPVGGVGNEIIVRPGDRVAFDVRISNWSGHLLVGVETRFHPSTLMNENGDVLTLFEPDLDGDGECDPGNEAYCSVCRVTVSPNQPPSGSYPGDCRSDHVSQIPPGRDSFWAASRTLYGMVWVTFLDEAVADPGDGSYYVREAEKPYVYVISEKTSRRILKKRQDFIPRPTPTATPPG